MLQVEVMLRQACGETAWVPVTSLQVMKRSVEHLTQLINDLLDASRIDAHELSLHRSVFDVEQRVQVLVQRLHPAVNHRPVNILQRDGNERTWADPVRFDQILTNLVENAAAYSTDGTPIEIEISAARGGVLISVRDKGPGIPADELPHLFERYYRGLSGRAKRRAGTGLGLFISRGLAEAHSGTLTVTSSVGIGTTFEFWLPALLPVGDDRSS